MPTFTSTQSCSCGMKFTDHVTVYESREERIADGRGVDSGKGNMVGGMGGLTKFSNMADHQEKADMMNPAHIMAQAQSSIEGY